MIIRGALLVVSGFWLMYALFKAWESEERPKSTVVKIAALLLVFLGTIFL